MRNQKVIYDSQDEDDGLSPLNSPLNSPAKGPDGSFTAAEEDNGPSTLGKQTGDSRSTDPDFFKRIHEEQQQKSAPEWVLDPMRNSQAQAGSSEQQKSSNAKPKNNSSSITDPTLKSARKKVLGKIEAKDLGNLTQVTTPSAPRAKKRDVYDFSCSDEEGAPAEPAIARSRRKTARSITKRKSADADGPTSLVTPQFSAIDETLDESPRPAKKKRKSTQDHVSRHVPDDIDLLVMPAAANMSQSLGEMNPGYDALDEMIPDTFHGHPTRTQQPPASFFIQPPDTLTSSQKKEYLRLTGYSNLDRLDHSPPPKAASRSSQHGGEEYNQQDSLPMARPAQTQGPLPTSASISTIAYTTPSRYASSVAPLPILDAVDGRSSNVATSSGRRSQLGKVQMPLSSPDELSAEPKDGGKRHMSEVDEEDEIVQQDHWNSDKIGYSRDMYVPRPSRRRSESGREGEKTSQAEADPRSTKRKRQEKGEVDETAHNHSSDSDIGLPKERYAPRPSRRRSRAVLEDDEDMQHPGQSMPDTCPPGNLDQEEDAVPILISSGQQSPKHTTENMEGVDPDFWAAMPEDIRQELRSQQPSHISQASRTRRGGRASEMSTSSLKAVPEETPQPKKRGRKKKEQKIEQASVAMQESAVVLEEPDVNPNLAPTTTTTKRKRGRPKKTETAPPPASEYDEEVQTTAEAGMMLGVAESASDANDLADEALEDVVEAPKVPKPHAKRGRKKKVLEETPEPFAQEDQDQDDLPEQQLEPAQPAEADTTAVSVEANDRQALRDISNTTSKISTAGKAEGSIVEDLVTDNVKQQEVTPEPMVKEKEAPKSGSTPGQQGKAPLRVGLSKKSRIPSLLKIIRK